MRRSIASLPVVLLAAAVLASCESGGKPASSPAAEHVHTVTVTRTVMSKRASAPAKARLAAAQVTAAKPASPAYVACDANISAKAPPTTCGFAENVFYEYWNRDYSDSFTAYSPAASATFDVTCSGIDEIACTTSTGASVRFSMAAVDAYTQEQADRYARSHQLGDASASADDSGTPPDSPPSSGGDDAATANSNDADPSDFCADHSCIPSFDEGDGGIVQCNDGEWSHSGGIQGACSSHEGESDRTYP